MNTAKRQFIYAIDQARVAGTLLAMFLTKSSFADNRSVSVCGYSLGTVVTFNCMKILKRLNDYQTPKAGQIINDIHFWAGAYVLDLNKTYEEVYEKSINLQVCNGYVNNMYTDQDWAVKYGLAKFFKGQRGIGMYPIFEDIKDEDKDECKLAMNYDVSDSAPGHSYYGSNCLQFLYKIKNGY